LGKYLKLGLCIFHVFIPATEPGNKFYSQPCLSPNSKGLQNFVAGIISISTQRHAKLRNNNNNAKNYLTSP